MPSIQWKQKRNRAAGFTFNPRAALGNGTKKKNQSNKRTDVSLDLTGGVGADVDDLALGSVDLVLVGGRQLGLHHDGVLRPGLERQDEVARLDLARVTLGGAARRVHVGDHPAVGAAGVLAVELGHVLEGSEIEEEETSSCGLDVLEFIVQWNPQKDDASSRIFWDIPLI